MPATSKAQARFMFAVQSGSIKRKGLSPNKAKEYTSGVSVKSLPERKKRGGNVKTRRAR